jgi:hypothetical protein
MEGYQANGVWDSWRILLGLLINISSNWIVRSSSTW